MITKQKLELLRKAYPIGTRIQLLQLNDPYTNLKSSDQGTVSCIDDIGTVFVNWDNGSRLGLCYGEDSYKKL